MRENETLTVCLGKGGQRDAAEAIARRVGVPLSDEAGDGLTLLVDGTGVSLTGYGMTYSGDFERMLNRVTDGRLSHEILVRVTKTKEENPTAVDATAGMGEDSFLLAAAGYNVTLYEKDPVVAALLRDALRRAKKNKILAPIVARMRLVDGDSIAEMPHHTGADLIYLDPMFPERQKSGLIGKKLQLIQHLEAPCTDENALLDAAFAAEPKKIIIKRPLKGAFLGGRKPQYSVNGKAIRYDCFVL